MFPLLKGPPRREDWLIPARVGKKAEGEDPWAWFGGADSVISVNCWDKRDAIHVREFYAGVYIVLN